MNKIIFSLAAFLGITFSPFVALAHERQVFDIADKSYLFTVGSLNEPVVVDDRTGVDLRVKLADPKNPGDGNAPAAKAIEGLEQSLKVEISAGDKKEILDLEPAYKDPGAYKAVFFPTVQTTYAYRFFGTIEGTPVNLTFTCLPAGTPKSEEDKSIVPMGDKINRTLKVGGFGCPLAKEALGFPELSMSINGLHEDMHTDLAALEKTVSSSAKTGTILGAFALIIAIAAFFRGRKKD